MPRMFAVTVSAVAVSAAQDLIAALPAAEYPIELYKIVAGQVTATTQENITISVVVGNTTAGSGGTAATPTPTQPDFGAANFTARINDTTVASAGTATTKHADVWNLLPGYEHTFYNEDERPKTRNGGGRICIRISAPGGARTVTATAVFIER